MQAAAEGCRWTKAEKPLPAIGGRGEQGKEGFSSVPLLNLHRGTRDEKQQAAHCSVPPACVRPPGRMQYDTQGIMALTRQALSLSIKPHLCLSSSL